MRVEYKFDIVAACPVDHKPDVYRCTVRATRVIPVEDILAAVADLRGREIYQEDLTRELHRSLAARVKTVGFHSGVRTAVVIGGKRK